MKITKIEIQKKKKNRYNIYLDDEFAFGVDEATLIKFALQKDMEVTKEQIVEIQREDFYQQAYQKALSFLNFKLRTTKEVFQKLEKLEYDEVTIHQVLQHLQEMGLLNDRFYAESYLHENAILAKKGPKAVAFELKKKGISDALIQQVLSSFSDEQQLEQALEMGQQYVNRQTQVSIKSAKQKVYTYLLQKGYDSDVIQQAISYLTFEQQEEQELQLALKEARRVYPQLARKYQEGQLWYQLKGKLYAKGFASDMIEAAIEQVRMESEG